MSLYANYITERTNDLIIEIEEGFATYCYLEDGKTVRILDVYVLPEFRKNGIASKLADMIVDEAKKRDCTILLSSVIPSTKYSTMSLKVHLGYKMTLQASSNDFILFRKDIQYGQK